MRTKVDKHIASLEINIDRLNTKINSLDEIARVYEYDLISRIKTNKSQLPFKVNNIKEVTKGHLLEEPWPTWRHFIIEKKERSSNLLSFPNPSGHFEYDAVNDLITLMDDAEANLWDWDREKAIKYSDLLASVDDGDKEKFMEQTIGHNKSYVITSPIRISSGNVIREELIYSHHPDDYERRSLMKITGVTNLIKVL
jgi:hypothetical protein